MSETITSDTTISRRRLGALALGGVGAAATGGLVVVQATRDDEPDAARTFEVVHDPAVYVTMTNGTEFEVAVKRTDTGEVLERFDRVTARSLLSLESDHVRFAEIG